MNLVYLFETSRLEMNFEEILVEISFIEKMRTTWGTKEVPQTFFHNSFYSPKYDLIRLIPYHLQPGILQF